MPANLTLQYLKAEEQYRSAATPEEKLAALQLMYRELPKHKGTDKLQADLKRKISEFKKASQKKKVKKKGISYNVENHGYQQVVVIGEPNGGRSQLISQLTQTELKVADYAYTTRLPHPAMMTYENMRIQLVDMPPLSKFHAEPWLPDIVRTADAVLLVADLTSDEVVENIEIIEEFLEKQNVYLRPKDDMDEFAIVKKTILLTNKNDIPDIEVIEEIIKETYRSKYEIFSISSKTGNNLEELKHKIFNMLEIIRIISKLPGKKADLNAEPIVLKKGSTVLDLAENIHKEIAQQLKTAKVWNSSKYKDGQNIAVGEALEDGNIIELIH